MSTINISLPEKQISQVDKTVSQYGFANRSEFIRSLLRFILRKPHLIKQAVDFPFVSPPKTSVKQIIKGFKKANKYSPAFVKDLEKGLRSSNFFKK